jgi:endonuclease/exonuclease/phosphatase family metal-dependent hydrolase
MSTPLTVMALLMPMFLTISSAGAAEPLTELRVMSFNIRYGSADDGANHWDLRKEFLLKTIQAFAPDLLGTQETLAFQRDYLAEKLPAYDVWAAGRDDGKQRGEMMAIYYLRERFEVIDRGHFWLSATPEVIGSKSWDSALPRMVSWIKLRDRHCPSAPPLAFLNTHFDHRGSTARLESARLLRQRVEELIATHSVILTGDFNAAVDSPPYRMLFQPQEGKASPLIDSYRQIHAQVSHGEGTFCGFKADATSGPRIDWIGLSREWKILQAAIDRTARDGRTPSDHFPVLAVIRRTAG